jgi:hypothetical protein
VGRGLNAQARIHNDEGKVKRKLACGGGLLLGEAASKAVIYSSVKPDGGVCRVGRQGRAREHQEQLQTTLLAAALGSRHELNDNIGVVDTLLQRRGKRRA